MLLYQYNERLFIFSQYALFNYFLTHYPSVYINVINKDGDVVNFAVLRKQRNIAANININKKANINTNTGTNSAAKNIISTPLNNLNNHTNSSSININNHNNRRKGPFPWFSYYSNLQLLPCSSIRQYKIEKRVDFRLCPTTTANSTGVGYINIEEFTDQVE